jgi:ribosomal protein L40E
VLICVQCGAENRTTLTACRMCGQPLNEGSPIPPRPVQEHAVLSSTISAGQSIACPVCGALNRAAWFFCEKCGSKLHDSTGASDDSAKGSLVEQPGAPAQPIASPPKTLFDQPEESISGAVTRSCPKCAGLIHGGSVSCPSCGASAPIDQTIAISSSPPEAQARLRLLVEGVETSEYALTGETVIGRMSGDILFPGDDYMSGRHARIVKQGSSYVLIDEGSRNGTFVKITNATELRPGDTILIGKQVFRFNA